MGKIIRDGIVYAGSANKANQILYDNTSSGLEANSVQAALDILESKVGDGGGISLTQAEYDALSPEEQMNGTYYIYDVDEVITASDINYDNKNSGLESDSVQNAIDEVANGYLPLSGGELSGNVWFNDIAGVIFAEDGATDTSGVFTYMSTAETGVGITVRNGDGEERKSRGFYFKGTDTDLKESIALWDTPSARLYKIFGEYNKPSGSYAGNGSATERKINVGGIGNLMVVIGCGALTFVTNGGGWSFRGSAYPEMNWDIDYSNGVLTLKTDNMYVNDNGTGFFFYVL